MLRSLVLTMVLGSLVACGPKKGGTLAVDTPVLPYKAPDIEELSGVSDDEPAEPPAEEPKAETAPTPAPYGGRCTGPRRAASRGETARSCACEGTCKVAGNASHATEEAVSFFEICAASSATSVIVKQRRS
jgi:hypothetical protein